MISGGIEVNYSHNITAKLGNDLRVEVVSPQSNGG